MSLVDKKLNSFGSSPAPANKVEMYRYTIIPGATLDESDLFASSPSSECGRGLADAGGQVSLQLFSVVPAGDSGPETMTVFEEPTESEEEGVEGVKGQHDAPLTSSPSEKPRKKLKRKRETSRKWFTAVDTTTGETRRYFSDLIPEYSGLHCLLLPLPGEEDTSKPSNWSSEAKALLPAVLLQEPLRELRAADPTSLTSGGGEEHSASGVVIRDGRSISCSWVAYRSHGGSAVCAKSDWKTMDAMEGADAEAPMSRWNTSRDYVREAYRQTAVAEADRAKESIGPSTKAEPALPRATPVTTMSHEMEDAQGNERENATAAEPSRPLEDSQSKFEVGTSPPPPPPTTEDSEPEAEVEDDLPSTASQVIEFLFQTAAAPSTHHFSIPLTKLEGQILKALPSYRKMSAKFNDPVGKVEAMEWFRLRRGELKQWLVGAGHMIDPGKNVVLTR